MIVVPNPPFSVCLVCVNSVTTCKYYLLSTSNTAIRYITTCTRARTCSRLPVCPPCTRCMHIKTTIPTKPVEEKKTEPPGVPVLTYETGQGGQSCDEICQGHSATCSMQGFYEVNSCSALQQKFPCSLCQPSIGPDQPAFVVADRQVKSSHRHIHFHFILHACSVHFVLFKNISFSSRER